MQKTAAPLLIGISHMTESVFTNLRLQDGRHVDVFCSGGRISAIRPAARMELMRTSSVDCCGQLLLPAFIEPHVHIDKTLWSLPWHPSTAGPAIPDYIANERRLLKGLDSPISVRSAKLLEKCIALGSLRIRSHIDVAPDIGLSHVEAMMALRDRYKDLCDLDFVAFPQTGILSSPGTLELMEEALKLGVETVGGIDPAGIDGDPIEHLRTVFSLADRYGCGVDIHLHDPGELGLWQVDRIADFTVANGLQGRVMISHAYCLGMADERRIASTVSRLASLNISIMTAVPIEPGAPPVSFLRAEGVNVCCGSDGIRDSWSPAGNGDMLERAFLLAFRFDWARDSEFETALDCATYAGAKALGVSDYGLKQGSRADFLFLPAENIGDALCIRPRERTVVRGGHIIAENGRLKSSRLG